MGPLLLTPASGEEFLKAFPARAELESSRPFLGEHLWVRFWVYRAAAGRITWRFAEGRARRLIPRWDRDESGGPDPMIELLRTVLEESEISWLQQQEVGGPHRLLDLMEQKILAEADRWISGAAAAAYSVEEGRKLVDALWQAEHGFVLPKGK